MKVEKKTKKTTKNGLKAAPISRSVKPAEPAPITAEPAKVTAKVEAKKSSTTAPTPIVANQAAKPAPTKTITTIEAKIDVGFGNNLFVRGEGPGLSWERGTPLKCVDPQTWQWTAEVSDTLKIKLLLNDSVWMAGEDIVVPPGKRIEVSPAF